MLFSVFFPVYTVGGQTYNIIEYNNFLHKNKSKVQTELFFVRSLFFEKIKFNFQKIFRSLTQKVIAAFEEIRKLIGLLTLLF